MNLLPANHMLGISVAVGAIVRMLKSDTMSNWLDRLPTSWINRIPKDWLPWLALMLAMIVSVVDATWVQHSVDSWQAGLAITVQGVFSGSLAIAGHETIAKTVGQFVKNVPPPTSIILVILTSISLLTATPGCGAIIAALPSIIAAVIDAGQIIDTIEQWCARYFTQHPDAAMQKKVDEAILKCRASLNILLRVAQGTENANDDKIDAAFEDFKQAYIALMQLVHPYGVVPAPNENAPPRMTVSTQGDTLIVPTPLAFHPRRGK